MKATETNGMIPTLLAAEYLMISVSCLQKARMKHPPRSVRYFKSIPFVRRGKKVFYRIKDLDQWMKAEKK